MACIFCMCFSAHVKCQVGNRKRLKKKKMDGLDEVAVRSPEDLSLPFIIPSLPVSLAGSIFF